MNKELIIERVSGLIEYCEAVKEDLELDGNKTGVDEYKLDIEALNEVLKFLVPNKYYELQTTSNFKRTGVYHNIFLTETELNNNAWQEEIKHLKSGEYCERYVHLKEISEQEYIKCKGY